MKDTSSKPAAGVVRIACFADSHGKEACLSTAGFETCDIVLFAGDFSEFGDYET